MVSTLQRSDDREREDKVMEGSVQAVRERATGWVRQSFNVVTIPFTPQVDKRASQTNVTLCATVNKVLLSWPILCEASETGVICARWTQGNDNKSPILCQCEGKDYDLVWESYLIISIMFNTLCVAQTITQWPNWTQTKAKFFKGKVSHLRRQLQQPRWYLIFSPISIS